MKVSESVSKDIEKIQKKIHRARSHLIALYTTLKRQEDAGAPISFIILTKMNIIEEEGEVKKLLYIREHLNRLYKQEKVKT